MKTISLTDLIAFVAVILFIGACSYVKEDDIATKPKLEENQDMNNHAIVDLPESKPRFGGCEDQACSNKELIQFISQNLKYPKEAREAGVEGKVYVQFIVEKNGSVSNAKVVRDIGAGCGEAALAVVESMNDLDRAWSPGIHDGKKVSVRFTLPFAYRLESKPNKEES